MARTKRDSWEELCKLVSEDDGFPVREVGPWTEDKLWFWSTYLDITSIAMQGTSMRRAFPGGLVYLDLFAGPGICRIRDSGRRIPGSAVIAAHAPRPLSHIHAVELEEKLAGALQCRLDASPAKGHFTVHRGDCNELAKSISDVLPSRALTLCFVDPPGLHAAFETLRTLAGKDRRIDFLILFADAYDAVRNVAQYVKLEGSNLDRALGFTEWRAPFMKLADHSGPVVRAFFADQYTSQLRTVLGYGHIGTHTIYRQGSPLYKLIYAARNAKGLQFWEEACKRPRSGQGSLF